MIEVRSFRHLPNSSMERSEFGRFCFSEVQDGWESETQIAHIRSKDMLVTRDTWRDFLQMIPTPPQLRTNSEYSFSLLSDDHVHQTLGGYHEVR